jgi:hypothetical protein
MAEDFYEYCKEVTLEWFVNGQFVKA